MTKPAKLSPRLAKLLTFLREVEKLREIEREIYHLDGSRENSSEHSWHLAMFVIVLAHEIDPKLDMERMLKLALVHDLVEIYAGDTPLFGNAADHATQAAREEEAAKKLFGMLPKDLKSEFHGLFEEFEARVTPESQVVGSLDRLQPIMKELAHNGTGWHRKGVTSERHFSRKQHSLSDHQLVHFIFDLFHEEATSRKLFIDLH